MINVEDHAALCRMAREIIIDREMICTYWATTAAADVLIDVKPTQVNIFQPPIARNKTYRISGGDTKPTISSTKSYSNASGDIAVAVIAVWCFPLPDCTHILYTKYQVYYYTRTWWHDTRTYMYAHHQLHTHKITPTHVLYGRENAVWHYTDRAVCILCRLLQQFLLHLAPCITTDTAPHTPHKQRTTKPYTSHTLQYTNHQNTPPRHTTYYVPGR